MKGDFCSRCGEEKVDTATGHLGPNCRAKAKLSRDQLVTIKMRIRIMEAKR